MASPTRLHSELLAFLRQHCPFPDQRQLVLLAWMVSGFCSAKRSVSTVGRPCFPWPMLAASWQRRCQRWLGNSRIDVGRMDGTLILWALQQWKNASQRLHLPCQLLKQKEALWTFLESQGIEPTNTAAERAWRPAVIQCKISHGVQSAKGGISRSWLLTVTTTLRQHGREIWPFLEKAWIVHHRSDEMPSLVPDP